MSMTALISAFVRAYHAGNEGEKVFEDTAARQLLGAEYEKIAGYMRQAAGFFELNPELSGEEALRHVVHRKLSALPLCRAAFTEEMLRNETRLGTGQYLVLGAGYDSFIYRRPEWARTLQVFLLDRMEMLEDAQKRAGEAGLTGVGKYAMVHADFSQEGWSGRLRTHPDYSEKTKTFVSMLGLTYYLEAETLEKTFRAIGDMTPDGSAVAFDYLDVGGSEDMRRQGMLARAAGEPMRQGYDYDTLEAMLDRCGFLIYDHLTPEALDERYFRRYNCANPGGEIHAMEGVNCCLAVRRRQG